MVHAPEVSIVIPTWNRSTLLRRAIESALAQTMDEIEIIVSDNASTDDTPEVVRSFDDPRITYSRLERNIGMHANLTRCLYLGTAPYLQLLHDDDVLYPRNTEVKSGLLDAHPSVGAVYAPVDVMDGDGRIVERNHSYGGRPAEGVVSGRDYLRQAMVQMGLNDFTATMIRRRDVEGESFALDDGNGCDLGLWMRLALRADFCFVDEVLSARRQHDDTQSTRSGSEARSSEGSYVVTVAYVEAMLRTKRRFVDLYGDQLEDADAWRRGAERSARKRLAIAIDRDGRGDRQLKSTVEQLGRAVRTQPSVVLERRAQRALGAAVIGQRGRDALRARRDATTLRR